MTRGNYITVLRKLIITYVEQKLINVFHYCSLISSKIDEQLKSLCLPSLPSQVFHKSTVFNGFKHVSVSDVQRIIAKIPAKTSSLDCIPIALVKTSSLDCIPIALVKSCSNIFGDLLLKLATL